MELIVNVTENWGIGLQDRLLVSIRADLQRFRQLTTGKTVVLGRRTLSTFPGGRPLKNRTNIILSTQPDFCPAGAQCAHSTAQLAAMLQTLPAEEICVIGGARVYALLLPFCSLARVTKTLVQLPADRFFPNLDADPQWRVIERGPVLEENGISFQYIDYQNTAPLPLSQLAGR